ncbi:MAG: hypothetical protein IT494_02850, partial [Gammaproteobacteria bacterium]|nr:hypothetical protein [Gammaproteobacteria bacterium]
MKWICMLLLVANLGFCGWAMNTELRHAATRARPLDLAAGMPSLTLLRELPELPARGESASNPDQTAPDGDAIDESISIFDPNPMLPSANLCVAAGPLADASQSVRLRDWLAARAVRVVAEVRAVRTRQLYTVFLEERDSAATTGPVSER